MRYATPLRYPGGKAKLAPFVQDLLSRNHLLDAHYVEPYAGGAGIAVSLLMDEYIGHAHINDLDIAIYGFWHSVLEQTDELCRLIHDRPVTPREWNRQSMIQRNASDHSLLEIGFSTFFLNRTNRSGIICSGGMIGGKTQSGTWKLDARYNKTELIERVERIALHKNRVSLTNLDAVALLKRLLPTLPRKSLLYLDPPYYVKGKRRLYANFYEHDDHIKVAKVIRAAKRPWIVSYDDAREIRDMYAGLRNVRYKLDYTARDRYAGSEIMIFSDNLSVPSVRTPLATKRRAS